MDLEQAKNVVLHELDAPIGRLAIAACVLCSHENSDMVPISELIACMRRGNTLGKANVVNEQAALALCVRTKRKRRDGHLPYEDFITYTDDWVAYLEENKFT
jgi:hypothetical protein